MRRFQATPQKKLIGMAILFVFVPLFLLWYWVFFLGHKPGTDTMVILVAVALLAAFLYFRYKKQAALAKTGEDSPGGEGSGEGEGGAGFEEEGNEEEAEEESEEAEEDEGEEGLDEAGEDEGEEDDFSKEEGKPVKAKAKTVAKKPSGKGKK